MVLSLYQCSFGKVWSDVTLIFQVTQIALMLLLTPNLLLSCLDYPLLSKFSLFLGHIEMQNFVPRNQIGFNSMTLFLIVPDQGILMLGL